MTPGTIWWNAQPAQVADLLADVGAVQRWIADNDTRHVLAAPVGFGQQVGRFRQLQLGGIHHGMGAVPYSSTASGTSEPA